jgi:enoyl-CoA hydratase / 3-hydroxyacyl-CoA dehydrogenase
MSTETETQLDSIVARMGLKTLVESCLVLEEGVASAKDIEIGMMMGAGILPGPFTRADEAGLDAILEGLEHAEREWGPAFEPPLVLRRLVAQGRLGKKTGQGFFPYPQPDDGFEQGETIQLETRGDVAVAWLGNPPANSISPQFLSDLKRVWEHVDGSDEVRALVIASANPMLYSAGADLKSFSKVDAAGGKQQLDDGHALLREFGTSSTVTIAAVNGLAFGGGCELAMACDVRLAADSATFGQPEINLGIIPGFGGTQRLPRLVGPAKALEMNATGDAISADDAYEFGLVNRVVPDHELFDTALAWARKLAGQAPLAIGHLKRVSHKADLDEGIEAEKEGFVAAFSSEDGREGISAFLEKRSPRWKGK